MRKFVQERQLRDKFIQVRLYTDQANSFLILVVTWKFKFRRLNFLWYFNKTISYKKKFKILKAKKILKSPITYMLR